MPWILNIITSFQLFPLTLPKSTPCAVSQLNAPFSLNLITQWPICATHALLSVWGCPLCMVDIPGATSLHNTDFTFFSRHQLITPLHSGMLNPEYLPSPCYNVYWPDLVQAVTAFEFLNAAVLPCQDNAAVFFSLGLPVFLPPLPWCSLSFVYGCDTDVSFVTEHSQPLCLCSLARLRISVFTTVCYIKKLPWLGLRVTFNYRWRDMNLESILILCLFSEIVVRGDVNEFIYLSGIHYEMCLYILYIYIYIHKSIALFLHSI